jgi:hypothetical protein
LAALGLEWKDLFPEEREWRPYSPRAFTPVYQAKPKPDEAHRANLERLWAHAIPLDRKGAEVGRRYLEARGLSLEAVLPGLQNLRLHPALEYREGGKVLGLLPALLARVEHPRHGLVALHRTYLAPDGKGKAAVPSPKKLTRPVFDGATVGAAIRLYPLEGEVLAVGLERVLVPEGVGRVLIAADHDQAGVEAAYALGERLFLQGLRVSLIFPEEDGMDWLDVLKGAKEEGLSAR